MSSSNAEDDAISVVAATLAGMSQVSEEPPEKRSRREDPTPAVEPPAVTQNTNSTGDSNSGGPRSSDHTNYVENRQESRLPSDNSPTTTETHTEPRISTESLTSSPVSQVNQQPSNSQIGVQSSNSPTVPLTMPPNAQAAPTTASNGQFVTMPQAEFDNFRRLFAQVAAMFGSPQGFPMTNLQLPELTNQSVNTSPSIPLAVANNTIPTGNRQPEIAASTDSSRVNASSMPQVSPISNTGPSSVTITPLSPGSIRSGASRVSHPSESHSTNDDRVSRTSSISTSGGNSQAGADWNFRVGNSDNSNNEQFTREGRLTLRVPEFTGKPEDYLSWRNRFDQVIMARKDDAATKFLALTDCVKNVSCLEHLSLWKGSDENLKEALAKMDKIYGNPTVILDAMIRKFSQIPKITKTDRLTELLELQSRFESLVATAKKYDKLIVYEQKMCSAILSKLPSFYLAKIGKVDNSGFPSAETILKVMNDRLNVSLVTERWKDNAPEDKDKSSRKSSRHDSVAFNQASTEDQECPFGDGNHRAEECKLTKEAKAKALIGAGRCYVCTRKGHVKSQCRSKLQCYKCHRRHHVSMCGVFVNHYHPRRQGHHSGVPQQGGSSAVANNVTPTSTDGTSDNEIVITIAKPESSLGNTVSYKTLGLTVQDNEGRWEPTRGLVDDGAGYNFVNAGLVARLNIPIRQGPLMQVLSFGSKSRTPHGQYVILNLRGNRSDKVFPMQFCVVDHLTAAHYTTPPKEILSLVPEKVIDDYYDPEELTVEIIIGITEAHAYIECHQVILKNDSHAFAFQTSELGTTVSGGRRKMIDQVPVNLTSCTDELLQEHLQAETPDRDNYVREFIQRQVRPKNGRIEVDIPMTGKYVLDTNYGISRKQMRSNCQRWLKKGMFNVVLDILRDWERDGIIEAVKDSPGKESRIHVLSYHVVAKLSSTTTKHRLVFNGSLKDKNGNTLNDFLFKGYTTWTIVLSLLGFRLGKFPLVGDLRQAFLMVQVYELDRDMFRFFWPSLTEDRLFRFARVPFGTSASPFLLFVAILKIIQLEKESFPHLSDLIDRFYVDDLVTSFDESHQRDCHRADCTTVFSKYGFQFGWTTGTEPSKVLGMIWLPDKDELSLKIPKVEMPTTIRDLASAIPSFYDPVGLIEPVISALRRLFSKAWTLCKDWNAQIPEGISKEINELLHYLMSRSFVVPRWVNTKLSDKITIYVLSDANPSAIGTTIYAQGDDDMIRLVFAKSVLHRRRTIPEAELDAMVLSVKLLERFFPADKYIVKLGTDSELNFHRLSVHTVNTLKYRQAIKVERIREVLDRYDYTVLHLPGKVNPADLMTKFEVRKFSFERWIIREAPVPTQIYSSASITLNHVPVELPECANLLKILDSIDTADQLSDLLNTFDLNEVIWTVQRFEWEDDIKALAAGKPLSRKSALGSFYYILVNGLLHTKTRMDADRTRIMIPATSRLVYLLWKDEHEKQGHAGVAAVRAAYLSTYFTRGTRQMFHDFTEGCEFCAYNRRRPTRLHDAPLQAFRCLAPARVYTNVGIDFAGPMVTTNGSRYIMLITCFHSRAVHLKLLSRMTTHAIIHGLRQFSALYGPPSTVYSDNAPSFVKADEVIKKLYAAVPEIMALFKWKFCFPNDPQTNGITEVMVKLTKKALKGLYCPRYLSALELETFVSEAQAVVNNRPLFVNGDEIITPNHFIYGRATRLMIQPTQPIDQSHSAQVHALLRQTGKSWWNKWYNGYLDRYRDFQTSATPKVLKVGDRIMYQGKKVSGEGIWPTGTVTATYPGRDGHVRLADIKLDSGEAIGDRTVRQLIRLHPAPPEVAANWTSVLALTTRWRRFASTISTQVDKDSDGYFDSLC